MQNIVVVGNSGSGKTAFVRRMKHNTYSDSYISTIGKDMEVIEYKGKKYILHDTAGQERFEIACQSYYKYAHGAIVFYETTDHSSIEKWVRKLRKEQEDIPIVLVGNKIDECKNYHVSMYPTAHISCKTGENVDKVLSLMVPMLKELKVLPDQTWSELFQGWYCVCQ